MSDKERDTAVDQIAKDMAAIKRWWPAIAALFAIIWGAIVIASNATSTWDTKVAKKEDIIPLISKIEVLNESVKILSLEIRGFRTYKTQDSIDKVVLNQRLTDNTKIIETLQLKVRKLSELSYVIERYDKNGQLILSSKINHN